MNIYQKLIEVRKTCQYLKKDNKGYQFQYVSSSQTLGTLRQAMDEQGLLLVPAVNSFEVRDHTTSKGGHENYTLLDMTFTWVNADNPEERVECGWTGQGLDTGEKGVGKALTYAEKYFLLKFFNIATDKDDPDAFQDKQESHRSESTKKEVPKFIPSTEVEQELRGAFSLDGLASIFKARWPMIQAHYNKAEIDQIKAVKDEMKAEFSKAANE